MTKKNKSFTTYLLIERKILRSHILNEKNHITTTFFSGKCLVKI
jgi:hypothetical protein